MRTEHLILAGFLALIFAQPATAEPTEIVIRVMAKDAKFIGHNEETGGMQIILRDADTGELLAQGLSEGGRGQTALIMSDGHVRRQILSPGAAKFSTILDLQRPRRITVTATGPMMLKENAMTVTATQWVLPGKSINGGDGWVLELPGFAVVLAEPLPTSVQLGGREAKIPIRAKITMQCGCIIEPGGLWDPAKFEIGAMLEKGGKIYPATALTYAGTPSMFVGNISVTEPGDYTVDLYAYDPANGNTGLIKVPLSVR
jgi:hypothetical protein